MSDDKRVEIEINPFKVMNKVKNQMLSRNFWLVWATLVLIMVVFYLLSRKYSFIIMESFSISDFLSPGITGLSFTLALITATTRIFSKDQLVDIYRYTDQDNPEKGYLFYRTIAPYIWTSTIWLIVTIGSLFAKIFIFNFSPIIHDILKLIYSSIVLMGVMSLWTLLTTHVKDISLETEREVHRLMSKEKENKK